eukprot:scpid12756/ scgid5903/ E3 SUMO-protein ligase RanBP2; 358 kDa nucleoporin; Nuclear pore complex protein Nup358; Nucleoporin Nup358; Ran-binding protein 2; p270; Putative peptidyl-prolyl cis-trans isomerase; Rotamase
MAGVESSRKRPGTAEDHFVLAKMAVEKGQYETGKRHAVAHIASNPTDVKGHNLLGDVYEKENQLEKAAESFRRSWELKNTQKAVVMKLANIYLNMPERLPLAEAWVNRALKLAPNDSSVKRLQEQLLTARATKADLEQLVGLLNRQLSENPMDMSLHIRYVQVNAKIGRLSDAFRYCAELDSKRIFYDEVLWLNCFADCAQKYLDAHELAATLRPQNNSQAVQRGRTTQLILLPVLSRIQQNIVLSCSLEEAQKNLLKLDCALMRAWDSSPPSQTSPGKDSLWSIGLNEIRAQLYFHVGVLLLKTATDKSSSLSWETASNLACVVFSASLAQPLFPKESTFSFQQPNLCSQLHLLSCKRLSEAGHIMDNFFERFGVDWMQQAVDQHCNPQGQGKLVEVAFGRLFDSSGMFLYNDSQFIDTKMELPGEDMESFDASVVENCGGDLATLVWLMRCQPIQSDSSSSCVHNWVTSVLPANFYMETSDIHSASPDTLCTADLEAFLVCVSQWTQCVDTSADNELSSFRPSLMPLALTSNLLTDAQSKWWSNVLDFGRNKSSDLRRAVRNGLQELRAAGSTLIDPDLLLAVSFYFAGLIEENTVPELMEPWQTRCLNYVDLGIRTARSLQSDATYLDNASNMFPLATQWTASKCRRTVQQLVGVRRSVLGEADASSSSLDASGSFLNGSDVHDVSEHDGATASSAIDKGNSSSPLLNASMISQPDTRADVETHVNQLKESALAAMRMEMAQMSSHASDFVDTIEKKQQGFMEQCDRTVSNMMTDLVQQQHAFLEEHTRTMTRMMSDLEKRQQSFMDQQTQSMSALMSHVTSQARSDAGEKLSADTLARVTALSQDLEKRDKVIMEELQRVSKSASSSAAESLDSKQQLDGFLENLQSQFDQFLSQAGGYYADSGEGDYGMNNYYETYNSPANQVQQAQQQQQQQNFQAQSQTHDYQRSLESVTSPSANALARISTGATPMKSGGESTTPTNEAVIASAAITTTTALTGKTDAAPVLSSLLSGSARFSAGGSTSGFKLGDTSASTFTATASGGSGSSFQFSSTSATPASTFTAPATTATNTSPISFTLGTASSNTANISPATSGSGMLSGFKLGTTSGTSSSTVVTTVASFASSSPGGFKPSSASGITMPTFASPVASGLTGGFSMGGMTLRSASSETTDTSVAAATTSAGNATGGFSLGGASLVSSSGSTAIPSPFQGVTSQPSQIKPLAGFADSLQRFQSSAGTGGLFSTTFATPASLLSKSDGKADSSSKGADSPPKPTMKGSASQLQAPVISVTSDDETVDVLADSGDADRGECRTGDDGDGDDDKLQFKPVVSLPKLVSVSSGEEEEDMLFCERTKLFRFTGGEWKERGIGELKILQHKTTGVARILMRREQVLKICANHRIAPEMELKPMKGSDRAWIWQTLADISEDSPQTENFVARFKNAEIADNFKIVFEKCTAETGDSPQSPNSGSQSESSSQSSSVSSSPEKPQTQKSPVSSQPDGASTSSVKLLSGFGTQSAFGSGTGLTGVANKPATSTAPFSFNAPSSISTQPSADKPLFGSSEKPMPFSLSSAPAAPPAVAPVSYTSASTGQISSNFGSTSMAPSTSDKPVAGSSTAPTPFSFKLPNSSSASAPSATQGSSVLGAWSTSSQPPSDKPLVVNSTSTTPFSFKLPSSSSSSSTASGMSAGPASSILTTPSSSSSVQPAAEDKPLFGGSAFKFTPSTGTASSSTFSSFSSTSLMTSTTGGVSTYFTTPTTASASSTTQESASSFGKLTEVGGIFSFSKPPAPGSSSDQQQPSASLASAASGSTSKEEDDEDVPDSAAGDDGDGDDSKLQFEPAVPLPGLITVSSGEEDEQKVFCERAKLYRFTNGEWKERGVGEMKVLRNPSTNCSRILMRREQVHKLCANHRITSEIDLKPMKDSERAWVWHALADFSEGVSKPEQFAVRFKSPDLAKAFKCAVDECRQPTQNSSSSATSAGATTVKTTASTGDSDELAVVFERKPTKEEAELARKYMLPDTFYLYEQKPACPGCLGCVDGDSSKLSTVTGGAAPAETKSSAQPTAAESSDRPHPQVQVAKPTTSSNSSASASASSAASQFVFGSSFGTPAAASGSSSFASLATVSDGFQTRNPGKTFSVTPGQTVAVFGSGSGQGQADDGEDPDPQFEPVVPLPDLVEVKTGEEDEEAVFRERCKLYRYTGEEWKERGLGEMKILRHKQRGNYRVLMRREQIHKVCANHLLMAGMSINLKAGTDRVLVWHTVSDLTEAPSRPENFALRLKTPEMAQAFIEAFKMGVAHDQDKKAGAESGGASSIVPDSASSRSTSEQAPVVSAHSQAPAATDTRSLRDMMNIKSGTWTCSGCYLSHDPSVAKCPACNTPQSSTQSAPAAPSAASAAAAPRAAPASAPTITASDGRSLRDLLNIKAGTWTCTGCYLSHDPSVAKCPACNTARPS